MNSNLQKTRVSAATFAKRYKQDEYFKLGYESVIKSLPFNYNIEDTYNSIAYERGRAFAIWCKQNNAPRAVWRKGVAANTLVDRVAQAATKGAFV